MGEQLFYIPYVQSCRFKDALNCIEGKIGKVLVVDGVELGVLNQAHEVGKFQGDHALGFECCLQTTGKVVDVRHMCVDVVASDKVSLLVPGSQLVAQRLTKEFAQHRYAIMAWA